MAESVAIEMSKLESTPKDPKPERGRRERPLMRSESFADLTGFRPLSEREKRQAREDAIETVVDLHPAPAPAPAPASNSQIWV